MPVRWLAPCFQLEVIARGMMPDPVSSEECARQAAIIAHKESETHLWFATEPRREITVVIGVTPVAFVTRRQW